MKLNKKEIICIIVMYVIFIVIVSGPAMNSDSMIGFGIIEILGLFCYFRFTKGRLNDALSHLIWPVWLVAMLILGATIGVFIAPYHLGKWIASKIPDNIESTGSQTKYDNSETNLKRKSDEELEEMYMNLIHIVIPASEEPNSKTIPLNVNAYGCKTWGEARNLVDLLAKVRNDRLK